MARRKTEQERLDGELTRARPRLLARLRKARRLRNWFWLDDEEGTVQEVLARVARHHDEGTFQMRDEASLWGYLTRTLFFVVMEAKDRARPEPLRLDDSFAFRADAFASSLDETLGHRRCVEQLMAEVTALQARYRKIVEATLAGLKTGAVARLLGQTPSQVAVAKCRALKALGRRLEEKGWLEACGSYFALEVSS